MWCPPPILTVVITLNEGVRLLQNTFLWGKSRVWRRCKSMVFEIDACCECKGESRICLALPGEKVPWPQWNWILNGKSGLYLYRPFIQSTLQYLTFTNSPIHAHIHTLTAASAMQGNSQGQLDRDWTSNLPLGRQPLIPQDVPGPKIDKWTHAAYRCTGDTQTGVHLGC